MELYYNRNMLNRHKIDIIARLPAKPAIGIGYPSLLRNLILKEQASFGSDSSFKRIGSMS